jgi:hypothetical protein
MACRILAPYCIQNKLDFVTFPCESAPIGARYTKAGRVTRWMDKKLSRALYSCVSRTLRKKRLVLLAAGGGTNVGAIVSILRHQQGLHVYFVQKGTSKIRTLKDFLMLLSGFPGVTRLSPAVAREDPLPSSIDHQDLLRERLGGPLLTDLRGQLVYCGVDFYDVFAPKLSHELFPFLLEMSNRVASRLEVLRGFQPDFVVSTGAREENYAYGEWARSHRIPFVMVSHGTTIAPKNQMEEIENKRLGRSLLLSQLNTIGVLQSPLEEAHVEHFQPSCQLVKAGPILFADLDHLGNRQRRHTRNEPNFTIMIGSSYKTLGSLCFWAMETPDEYIASCRDVVDAVNGLDDSVRLCIRFHVKLSMTPDDFRTLLPDTNRLSIDRGGRFLDSLRKCDMVVNFASSSIEESVQNDVPVLLYDRWDRYRHCDATAVVDPDALEPSGVYYLNQRALLGKTLGTIVEHIRSGSSHDEKLFQRYQYPSSCRQNFDRLFESGYGVRKGHINRG